MSVALHALVGTTLAWEPRRSNPPADPVEIGLSGPRAQKGRGRIRASKAPAVTASPAGVHSVEIDGVKNDGAQADARDRYLDDLRVLLEGRKTYPKVSRYMNESGLVRVRFVVRRDGRIEGIQIVQPSAFERLNRAAHDLVASLATYEPPPGNAASVQVELPIEYVLK